MNLRKWCSNDAKAISALPNSLLAEDKITMFNPNSSIPLLGIAWNSTDDYFCFHLQDETMPTLTTNRNVLSHIARMFDPLGWISPATIVAKILLQSLWLQKLTWDEPLPNDVSEKWTRWV